MTKSTVPVGTGAAVRAELAQRGLENIHYASNPEFLREGTAIEDFMHADRIVVGADEPGVAERVAALYESIDAPVLTTDIASAEMIKYASNAFLATKISFINEIANVCEVTGADVASWQRGWVWTAASGRNSCRPASATEAAASPKTSRPSSRSPATPAITSSCSTRSSR